MAEEIEGTTKPDVLEVPIRFVRSDDMRLFFSNFLQVSAGQSGEVQLFFGQLLSEPLKRDSPTEAVVRQDIGITVTFFEYKRMVNVLTNMLPRFEQIFAEQAESQEKPGLTPPPKD